MDGLAGMPQRGPLGHYFLGRLERLLTLPTSAIAARGEPGLALVLWALRSTFGDCRALGCGHEATLLLAAAPRTAHDPTGERQGA
ncbi:MAG TPA: hypothetical protein VK066_04930 [Chloroflexota bacterium]|nr:hypothetical protein [Chloroflexota bacterium]